MLVVGVSMLSSQTIAAKCSDSYPIKVVDNRSYASKCRPVGSGHHILGCISARYVETQAYFDIEADASNAEILITDFKPSLA